MWRALKADNVFLSTIIGGFPDTQRALGDPTVAYVVMLPLDEEKRLAPKFEGGTANLEVDMIAPQGHPLRGMNLGGCFGHHLRVPPELLSAVPARIVVRPGKGRCLPDFGLAPWGGWSLVSQAFVDIVERLEPGTNQFLPIAETVDHKGHAIVKRFFLMNILQQLNAVDAERSSVEFQETHHVLVV